MFIDSHVHVWSYPALEDLDDKIKSTEDLITFRTRYPDLYDRTLTEDPIDNSDRLIEHMDRNGVDKAIVQARPGAVTNDQVAQSVRRHPDRLYGLLRIGHDQEAAYEYVDDPEPIRNAAPAHIEYCLDELGMKGMWGNLRPRLHHLDRTRTDRARPNADYGHLEQIQSTDPVPDGVVAVPRRIGLWQSRVGR